MTSTTKLSTFQAVMARYAAIMGGSDLTVQWGGNRAFAAKHHHRYMLNIPALPAGTVMTPQQEKVYSGYVDHEAAHVRWTNFEVIADFTKGKPDDPLRDYLINLVEDIRIENKQIDRYPGSRIYLDALAEHVDRESRDAIAKRKEPFTQADQIIGLIYKELFKKYRDCDTKIIPGELSDFSEMKPVVDYLAKEMSKLASTKDTLRIATGIQERLPKNIDWAAPKAQEADEDEEPAIVFLIPGRGMAANQAAANALNLAIQGQDQHVARKKVIVVLMGDIKDLNAQLAGESDLPEQGPVLPPAGTAGDRIFTPAEMDLVRYESARAACSAEITATKKMLSIYLRAKTHAAWEKGLEEGRLDTDALYQLSAMPNPRVMKEKRVRDQMKTAVELLIDLSGSMNSQETRTTAIILAEALNGIRWLKLDISGFATNYHHYPAASGCGRMCGIDLLSFKTFDEPYPKAAARIGALDTGGYTPLGEAYGHGLARLVTRTEPRKVLWIVSDGEPYLNPLADWSHSEYELMRRSHAKCRRLGIETVGTYLSRQSFDGRRKKGKLKAYVDRYSEVESTHELPQSLMAVLKEVI